MKFSQFISEMEEPITMTIGSSDVFDSLNQELQTKLSDIFSSPEGGFQTIRNIMASYDANLPMIDNLDSEGDEMAIDIETPDGPFILYVIYSLTDNDDYEFYAEIIDDDDLEEILSDEDEEEKD